MSHSSEMYMYLAKAVEMTLQHVYIRYQAVHYTAPCFVQRLVPDTAHNKRAYHMHNASVYSHKRQRTQ
jgi:hypothetical protein